MTENPSPDRVQTTPTARVPPDAAILSLPVSPGSPDPLMTAIAALSRIATGPFTVRDLLHRLVELAAEHLQVDGAGAMTLAESGALMYVHASQDEVCRVEQLQELMQQGPCRDAVAGQREIVVGDLGEHANPQWSAYLAGAAAAGLGSVVAIPLLSRGRAWGVLDLYRHQAGEWSPRELATARLLADVAVSYVVMALDRDQARQAQRQLAHRSLHDELTGLPNRTLLFDRLTHALRVADRHAQSVAVFFFDLDRFKAINDTFGHAAGDSVLVQASSRVKAALRAEDTLARLAGDEFVVICEQLPDHTNGQLNHQLAVVADRIRAAVATPTRIGGADLVISASVGVALSSPQSTAEDLLADADAAMYRAKQHSHAELVIHDAESTSAGPTARLDRELAGALTAGQLRVHYQPIVSAAEHQLCAVEALLRWEHPQRGLLTATEFIAVAERTGLIVPIGHWVIDTVCAQLRAWQDQLGHRAPPVVYVNLSTRELTDPALPAAISSALSRHRLAPHDLGLELVESSFINPQLLSVLQDYHDRGHPLSVDDFGTGYSSLSRLVELPVALAKIDKSFVSGIVHDHRRRALIGAVLTVADSLGLQVIAEGVETAEQARHLTDAGCPLLQGLHLGAPEPAAELALAWSA